MIVGNLKKSLSMSAVFILTIKVPSVISRVVLVNAVNVKSMCMCHYLIRITLTVLYL